MQIWASCPLTAEPLTFQEAWGSCHLAGHLSFKRWGSRKAEWRVTMLNSQSIGDLSAVQSGFAPQAFCHSPLLMGLAAINTIPAGLGVLPLIIWHYEIASRYDCRYALLWPCLQSCYLAGLPVQCQVEEKPLRLHLLLYLLGCCYVFWLGAGYQSRQNQLSKPLHIWHTSICMLP